MYIYLTVKWKNITIYKNPMLHVHHCDSTIKSFSLFIELLQSYITVLQIMYIGIGITIGLKLYQ